VPSGGHDFPLFVSFVELFRILLVDFAILFQVFFIARDFVDLRQDRQLLLSLDEVPMLLIQEEFLLFSSVEVLRVDVPVKSLKSSLGPLPSNKHYVLSLADKPHADGLVYGHLVVAGLDVKGNEPSVSAVEFKVHSKQVA